MLVSNKIIHTVKIISFLVLFLSFFTFRADIFAQTPEPTSAPVDSSTGDIEGAATLGVAHIVVMQEKNVEDGSIVVAGGRRSTIPYDSQISGVVSRDAAIILNSNSGDNGLPVISTGTVYVLVSTQQGNIKKGDLITSSTIPGVGVKATNSGYVMGTAMEDYSNSNPKQIDKITVSLDLHYFNSKSTFPGTLSDIFKFVILPTKESPTPIFKYIVAAIVVLGSFILGFLSFGRTAAKGVEALGRNPAASKIIHLGIIFNVMIVGLIVAAGLTVAFLILRL